MLLFILRMVCKSKMYCSINRGRLRQGRRCTNVANRTFLTLQRYDNNNQKVLGSELKFQLQRGLNFTPPPFPTPLKNRNYG